MYMQSHVLRFLQMKHPRKFMARIRVGETARARVEQDPVSGGYGRKVEDDIE